MDVRVMLMTGLECASRLGYDLAQDIVDVSRRDSWLGHSFWRDLKSISVMFNAP